MAEKVSEVVEEKVIEVVEEEADLPHEAPDGTTDTREYYRVENVSFGTAITVELDDQDIRFTEATVKDVQKFDARNLAFCKYLNIRNSSFNEIEAEYLNSLLLIDISNTKI